MESKRNVHLYGKLDDNLKKKAAKKYIEDPRGSLIRIPSEDGMKLSDAIEVLHNGEYHLVLVTEEDLKKIHWDAFENSNDNMYMPYMDNENYDDLFEEGTGY